MKGRKVVVISLFEHVGDIISCEPVVRHLKSQDENCYIIWVTNKDYIELVKEHPQIDKVIPIDSLSEWVILRMRLLEEVGGLRIIDLHLGPKYCSKYGVRLDKDNFGIDRSNHLRNRSQLEAFSLAAGLPCLTMQPYFFLKANLRLPRDLKKPFIVFHTTSNMQSKDWAQEKWIELAKYFWKKGYAVAEIGYERNITFENELYFNYTGKKSFQAIAHILKASSLFVGIDSGFAHMANALEKNGVVLIGEYHIEEFIHKKYNPFSGMYKDQKYIIYPQEGLAKSIEVQDVIKKVEFGHLL